MARIRTIKPEFWSSPGIDNISPWARLLFIAMWNWADDAGRGTCQLRELQAFAFPLDEEVDEVASLAGFRRVLAEVRDQFDVVFYKVDGRPYYAIPSWNKHQRNERTAKSRHPAPEEGQIWDFLPPEQPSDGTSDTFRRSAAEGIQAPSERTTTGPADGGDGETTDPTPAATPDPAESPKSPHDLPCDGTSDTFRRRAAEAPRSSGPGTGEQGNRGSSAPTERGGPPPAPPTPQDLVAEWLNACAKRPPKNVVGQVSKHIKQMLDENVATEDIRAGLRTWRAKGLHPSTLPSVVNEVMNTPDGAGDGTVVPLHSGPARPSTTDQRVAAGMALVAELEALEQTHAEESS